MNALWRFAAVVLLVFGSAGIHNSYADTPSSTVKKSLDRDAVCTRCHDENEQRPVLSIYKTPHGVKADERTPSCQSCHGESLAHIQNKAGAAVRPAPDVLFGYRKPVHSDYERASAATQNSTCLTCHNHTAKLALWAGSQHENRDIPCAACHKVHVDRDPVMNKVTQPEVCFSCHQTQRAQMHKISTHPVLAGKMACSDCHNPMGSTGPTLLIKNSVNETCYTCHADKRGPFLWEHGPVVDNCLNCHTPHGSNNPTLLKQRPPYLCQDCHSGDHARMSFSGSNLPGGNAYTAKALGGAYPQGAVQVQTVGRSCLNCHSMVHGSNSPAGAKFQR